MYKKKKVAWRKHRKAQAKRKASKKKAIQAAAHTKGSHAAPKKHK